VSAPAAITKEVPSLISDSSWEEAGIFPCILSVDLSLKHFTVRDLLQLNVGTIVESENPNGADIPVVVNGQLIAWAEFEVVGQKIAVRLTELV
jgi:flagellar motor switch protein FliN/FliY